MVSTISPATGVVGQTIKLNGANLFSANGAVTVTFGRSLAPVVCPNQTTCLVTVPPRGSPTGSAATPVTVITESGTSTPKVFIYR